MSAHGLMLLVGGLTTAGAPESRPMTFDQAIELAVEHPAHAGLGAALEVRRREDAEISGLAYDPQLFVNPGYRHNPDDSAGFEGIVQISQSWSLSGLGGARRDAASRERAALSAQVRADALARRAEAARRWIELRVRERAHAQARRELEYAVALATKLEAAAAAGVVLRTDFVEARAYAAEMRAAAVEAEGRRVHAQLDLATALALGLESALETDGEWPAPQLPPVETWPGLVARAAALPAAQQVELTALAARARAEEARAEGGWTLQTQVSFQRESPTSYISWLGVGVKLPVFDGARRSRALAAAEQVRAEARRSAAPNEAARVVSFALHEVQHAREQLAVTTEHHLPALRELVRLRTQAFDNGEGTALELLRAKQRLTAASRASIHVQGDLRWAEVEAWLFLAALQGGPSATLAAQEDRP